MEQLPIEERIERHKSFYAMDLDDGPLVGFFLGTYYPLIRYNAAATIPEGPVSPEEIDPKPFEADYFRMSEAYKSVEGDTMWTGSVFWGIPWMEALSGCGIVADHATGSCRALLPKSPPAPRDIPVFDPASPWIRKAGEFIDLLTSSGSDIPLGTTLMRGFSDMLSALYGTPDFIYRLADGGIEIEEVTNKLASAWIDFANYQLDRFPRFSGGTGSYFYNLWLPGRGVWIQEVASALLSPSIFDRYILPGIERVVDAFDSVIIHLHPTDFIPIDPLIHSNLKAIELHVDKGGPTAQELLPVYRRIQKRKPLVIWGDLTTDDLTTVRENLDLRSLAVLPVVESSEHAETLLRMLR